VTTARLICKKCGHKFTAEILEKGEAQEKRLSTSPVLCPKCRSAELERY